MARVLERDEEDATEVPSDSGWWDTCWREMESDDAYVCSMLACMLSAYSDLDDVDVKMVEDEREAEETELDEMMAGHESMRESSRLDDSGLDIY
jgi:hypothetical protein